MYGSYLSSLPMKLPQLARVVRGLFGIHSAAIQIGAIRVGGSGGIIAPAIDVANTAKCCIACGAL